TIDRIIVTAPIFGPIFLMTIMSRFSRVLSALLASGIPIVRALDIVRGVVGNKVVEVEIDRMRDGVVAGQGLAEPRRGSPINPPGDSRTVAQLPIAIPDTDNSAPGVGGERSSQSGRSCICTGTLLRAVSR